MTLYEELLPKQKRIIKRDVSLILSLKGLSFPKTIEDLKALGFFSPKIKVGNKEIYLSVDGRTALRRICDIINQSKTYENLLTYSDIYKVVLHEIERWLSDQLVPNDVEFLTPLDKLLSEKIDTHTFVCKIDGISFDNIDNIVAGSREIRKYEDDLIEDISDVPDNISEAINKEYSGNWVVLGSEKGSSAVAQEKFFHNAELLLSIFRLFSCAFYGRAIHNINIRLINNCSHAFGPASCFGWPNSTKSISFTRYFRSEQDFKINKDLLEHLIADCFFKELHSLIDKQDRTEVEDAVIKSLYWIGEAQKDPSPAAAWLKLWSCLECFFTLGDDEITEKNARGISSILLYGGYLHDKYDDYDKVKKKIKNFYKLRSKIVHRAEFTHIDLILLEELSYISAWIIVSMVSLADRGYTTLSQVQEQIERLDKISTQSTNTIPINSGSSVAE